MKDFSILVLYAYYLLYAMNGFLDFFSFYKKRVILTLLSNFNIVNHRNNGR